MPKPFISELHYRDSVATDTGIAEYVEVAFLPEDKSSAGDYTLTTYQQNGAVEAEQVLSESDLVYDAEHDKWVYTFNTTLVAWNNVNENSGQPEAVSLVNHTTGEVIDFYDIGEGARVTADGGAADGATSEHVSNSNADGDANPPADGFADTGTIQFRRDGTRVDDAPTPDQAPCFTKGTLIATPDGTRPVETLRPGDPVITMDHGTQPVRWVANRSLSRSFLKQNPHLAPIRIHAGAFGPGLPAHDLTVSPQHRLLVASPIAQRVFGHSEVLVPAKKLLTLPGVEVDDESGDVTYCHFMFDNHEVVFSNGLPTESLYAGPETLKALPPEAAKEMTTLFPGLFCGTLPQPARPIAQKNGPVGQLVRRHVKNHKPMIASQGLPGQIPPPIDNQPAAFINT